MAEQKKEYTPTTAPRAVSGHFYKLGRHLAFIESSLGDISAHGRVPHPETAYWSMREVSAHLNKAKKEADALIYIFEIIKNERTNG